MKRITSVSLPDKTVDRFAREVTEAVRELQAVPAVSVRIVRDVVLADGQETAVPHGLGRPAQWVRESCPRGAVSVGMVEEIRSGSHDRSKVAVLKASGWGATITVDVLVA